jgi:hypothetical protein
MILRILLTLYIKIKIFIKTTTRECKKYIYIRVWVILNNTKKEFKMKFNNR